MKKVVNILSLVGIVIAPASIGLLYSFETQTLQAKASAIQETVYEDFPVNQPRFIDFLEEDGSLEKLNERQQKNQIRDWLLFTIVSSKGLSTSEINQNLKHLPIFRYGYRKPLSNLQYGDTRSLHIGQGQIVALLPKNSSKQERMDNLAQIADRHHQNLGTNPTSLVIFEYEINSDRQFALVTKREVLDTRQFFREGNYGYHETPIKNLDDLRHFIERVDYITFAQVKDSNLTLGGRKISSHQYPKIRLKDIAALWQSEKTIQEPGNGFSLEPSYDYRSLEKFFAKVEPSLRSLTSGATPAITQQDIQEAKVGLAQHNEIPYLVLANKLTKSGNPQVAEQGRMAIAQAIRSRFQVARYGENLEGTEVGMLLFYTDLLAKLWALDYLSNTLELDTTDFQPPKPVTVVSTEAQQISTLSSIRIGFGVQNSGVQVADKSKSLFLEPNATQIHAIAYNHLQPSESKTTTADADAFLRWWSDRYEEVLVQKEPQYERLDELIKWGYLISWLKKSQQGEILDFLRQVPVKQNLWFPDWARANSKQLKFPIWNQVNFYERGYKDAITEAMPILASQVSKPMGKETTFLSGGVRIPRLKSNFDSNAHPRPESNVPANRQTGDPDSPSNPKPNLNEPDSNTTKNPNSPFNPKPGSDGSTSNKTKNSDSGFNLNDFKLLDGTSPTKKLSPLNLAPITGQAKENVNFNNSESESPPLEFENNISRTVSGFRIATNVEGTTLGSFNVEKTANGFAVGWRSQDIILEQSLLLELNQDSTNVEAVLSKHPDVEKLYQLQEDPLSYLAKMQGSNRWMKVETEVKSSSNTPKDRLYRLGNFGGNSRNIILTPIDEQVVKRQLEQGLAKPVHYDPPRGGRNQDVFAENLRNNRYDAMAQDLAQNPAKFFAFKNEHFNAELKQIDNFLQARNYTRAAQRINRLIHFSGRKPELMIRKALADVGKGRVTIKLVTLTHPEIAFLDGKNKFLKEVNGLLERSNGRVRFFARNTKNAVFYVQDAPGLNNINWNLPIDQTLPLISATTQVYQLQPGEIGAASLSAIGYADPSSATQVSTQADSSSRLRPRNYQLYNNDKCEPGNEEECCEEGLVEYCKPEKPIYIVISPDKT